MPVLETGRQQPAGIRACLIREMRQLGYGGQRSGRIGAPLLCLLILLSAVALGGCKQLQERLNGSRPAGASPPGERLIAYEQGGNIWTIEAAAGAGVAPAGRQITRTGDLMLGPWAPDSTKLAVLSEVNRNGEWATGNAGVLDLNGNLKPVSGPEGPVVVASGEISWLDADNLALGGLSKTIWIARYDGSQYRAAPLYTVREEGNERVWHPRAVPGGAHVSFWITNTEGAEGKVTAHLVTVPIAGGQPETIFSQAILASGQAPVDAVWALDARYVLIYAEPADGGNPWWLLDRSKGARQAVLSPEAGDIQWLPGDRLIYAPQALLQAPGYALFDPATGRSEPFATVPDWVNWLQVAADGRLLLARTAGGDSISWDYYVAADDGTNARKIIGGAGDAAWQP